jgi:hypothetical protein
MDLQETGRESLDWILFVEDRGKPMDPCKENNELSGYTKHWKFPD